MKATLLIAAPLSVAGIPNSVRQLRPFATKLGIARPSQYKKAELLELCKAAIELLIAKLEAAAVAIAEAIEAEEAKEVTADKPAPSIVSEPIEAAQITAAEPTAKHELSAIAVLESLSWEECLGLALYGAGQLLCFTIAAIVWAAPYVVRAVKFAGKVAIASLKFAKQSAEWLGYIAIPALVTLAIHAGQSMLILLEAGLLPENDSKYGLIA